MEIWEPIWGILIAVALSLAIGVERDYFAKAAGMRTYTLVGMGSALFTAVSKYGFQDTVLGDWSRFDGSRVAAQVVTGIGFLGAGLIFVRKDTVRGLTTAAGVWFVAAVGMTAGSGMHLIAALVTALYFLVMVGIRPIARIMPRARSTLCAFTICYLDGRGVLRSVIETVSNDGLKVADMEVRGATEREGARWQEIWLEVEGASGSIANLGVDLEDVPGVLSVAVHSVRSPRRNPDD